MKKLTNEIYATPEVEIVELNLEQGFAGSSGSDIDNVPEWDFSWS